MIVALVTSTTWYFVRGEFANTPIINEVEPMLVGMVAAFLIHSFSLAFRVYKI